MAVVADATGSMYFRYKRHLWFVFSVFFLVLSPFLAVYSLGYSFDTNHGRLANTIDIDVVTIPRGASVWNNNFEVLKTPGSLKAKDGQLISLTITKENYLTEKFDIWSQPNRNTTARLGNIYLLPKQSQVRAADDTKAFLTILSRNLLLFEQQGQIFVQLYGFGGLQGNPEPVKNVHNAQVKYENEFWEDLLEDTYWQPANNWFLHKINGSWRLLDLDLLGLTIHNVVRVSEDSIVILDSENKLWLVDFNPNLPVPRLTFLTNDIDGVSFTKSPDSIWLWRKADVFAIPRGNIRMINHNLENYRYFSSSRLANLGRQLDDSSKDNLRFAVKNLHQGLIFKIQNHLYYVADFDKTNPVLVTNDVVSFVAAGNTVFWLDSVWGLYSSNLGINKRQYFGVQNVTNIEPRNLRLFYYGKWERLMIYSGTQVISIWFDKNILNDSVVTYYPNTWITNAFCKDIIYEGFQFCLQDNQLISYQNTEIW